MKPAAWRLALTALLFLGWVGYLGYLVLTTRGAVVLSRPQFLVAELHVVATRDGTDQFVVNDVLWPADKKEEWRGKKIVIKNIAECQTWSAAAREWRTAPPPEGQRVLLPLVPAKGGDAFDVVPIPPSPGYQPPDPRRGGAGPPRVYPADPRVLDQYNSIPKP